MSQTGETDIRVTGRRALLDALEALAEHRDAVVLVGAQAIYLHTGDALVALAESTKDSDLAAGFRRMTIKQPVVRQAWRPRLSTTGQ